MPPRIGEGWGGVTGGVCPSVYYRGGPARKGSSGPACEAVRLPCLLFPGLHPAFRWGRAVPREPEEGRQEGAADAGRGLAGLRDLRRPGWDWRFGSAPPGGAFVFHGAATFCARCRTTRGRGPRSGPSAVAARPRLRRRGVWAPSGMGPRGLALRPRPARGG